MKTIPCYQKQMQMAKIITERAYIEPFGEDEEDFAILIHIKEGNTHTYVGKVELDRNIPWIYLENTPDGHLEINNSAGMENNKWDYITEFILGEENE